MIKQRIVKAFIYDADIVRLPPGMKREELAEWQAKELERQGIDVSQPYDFRARPQKEATEYVQLQPVS